MLQGPSSSARTRELLTPSERSFALLSKTPLLLGSGQPGMPWERMQRAKANADASVPLCAVVGARVVAAVGAAVVEATLAPPAELPPPQPAASSANATTTIGGRM